MEENTARKMQFVPATCTKCGAALDVDPSQDAAVCPYCDTPFIVEKAINNYNMQNAHIDHVDNVTLDMKGSVDSVLSFASEQMSEHRKARAEEMRLLHENSKSSMKTFFIMFGILCFIMIAMWFVMSVTGFWA